MVLILLAQVAATLIMVGVIWFVQIVHYPLFDRVGEEVFSAYEVAHSRLTTRLVGPIMFVEAVTAVLLILFRPVGILPGQVWIGAGLLAIIWLLTMFAHIPQHNTLALGFDPTTYRALVSSNWIRTLVWSLRGLLVLGMVASMIHRAEVLVQF